MKVLTVMLIVVFIIGLIIVPPEGFAKDKGSKYLMQGLLGAGVGAAASGASGGKAGKGALIGAGVGMGGAILMDALTGEEEQPRRSPQELEREDLSIYEQGYEKGYTRGYERGKSQGYDKGHEDGYRDGYKAGLDAAKK